MTLRQFLDIFDREQHARIPQDHGIRCGRKSAKVCTSSGELGIGLVATNDA